MLSLEELLISEQRYYSYFSVSEQIVLKPGHFGLSKVEASVPLGREHRKLSHGAAE